MILLMLSLFLGACTVTDPPEGSADDSGSGAAEGTDGTCEGYSAGDAVSFETVYSGSVSSASSNPLVEARIFDDEASWTAFLGTLTLEGGAPATVDFGVSRVAAGMVLVPGTCGLSVSAVTVTQAAGEVAHVDLSITDASGGCDTACDMVGQALIAVSVPRDAVGEPTVCTRVEDGC